MHNVQCTMYNVQCTLYIQCTESTVICKLINGVYNFYAIFSVLKKLKRYFRNKSIGTILKESLTKFRGKNVIL